MPAPRAAQKRKHDVDNETGDEVIATLSSSSKRPRLTGTEPLVNHAEIVTSGFGQKFAALAAENDANDPDGPSIMSVVLGASVPLPAPSGWKPSAEGYSRLLSIAEAAETWAVPDMDGKAKGKEMTAFPSRFSSNSVVDIGPTTSDAAVKDQMIEELLEWNSTIDSLFRRMRRCNSSRATLKRSAQSPAEAEVVLEGLELLMEFDEVVKTALRDSGLGAADGVNLVAVDPLGSSKKKTPKRTKPKEGAKKGITERKPSQLNMATMKCRCSTDVCRQKYACKRSGNSCGAGCFCHDACAMESLGFSPCFSPFTPCEESKTVMDVLFGAVVPPFSPIYPSSCFANFVANEKNWKTVDDWTPESLFRIVRDATEEGLKSRGCLSDPWQREWLDTWKDGDMEMRPEDDPGRTGMRRDHLLAAVTAPDAPQHPRHRTHGSTDQFSFCQWKWVSYEEEH